MDTHDTPQSSVRITKLRNNVQLMGVAATVTPFIKFNSSPRVYMLANHLAQAPSPKKSDIPRVMACFETQLQSFNITMPVDAVIVSVHPKYRRGADKYSVKSNPLITLVYQNQETGVYDILNVETHYSKHRVFGHRYVQNPLINRIRPGMYIEKDTVLAYSPNIKEGGIYSNSLSCNIINLSLPCTIEDGYGVSESFCERAGLTTLTNIDAQWGKKTYLLNIYGDPNDPDDYKGFPNIGDRVRPDGLVFAMREYNPIFDAIEMTNASLREVDLVNDILVYGTPNALVYDVLVESGIGESAAKPVTPEAMTRQPQSYIRHLREYYSSLLSTYELLSRNNPGLVISPRMTELITRAYADTPNKHKNATGGVIRRMYKNVPLDEYRVRISIEDCKPLGMGAKLTGLHGDKGVICSIMKTEHMPVDKDGNRADIIKYARTSVARLNAGQHYEAYIAGSARDLSRWVRNVINVLDMHVIWNRVLTYYKVAAPKQYEILCNNYITDEHITKHLQSIVESGIYLYIPADSEHLCPEIFHAIEAVAPPTYGPVTYVDVNGRTVVTHDKAFIGVQQIIVLEKSDQHPMAVSSATLQHHGLISGPNRAGRVGHGSKVQATKVKSETEVRMDGSLVGPVITAEALNMSNSPESHKCGVRAILVSDTPTNISKIQGIIQGTSRPLMFVNHVFMGLGIKISKVLSRIFS